MIDGQFEVKTILGQGGSSRVVRCMDFNQSSFALKIIKSDKNYTNEKAERMLFKEYYISQMLNGHPNILRCLSSITDGRLETENGIQSIKYNVLDIAENGSLSRFIRTTGPIEENIAKFLFIQCASAVKYMHDLSVAHFDIKLENILLDENYNIKIADFGSAEIMQNKSSHFNYKKGTN